MNLPTAVISRATFEALPVVPTEAAARSWGCTCRYLCTSGQWLLLNDPRCPGGAVIEIAKAEPFRNAPTPSQLRDEAEIEAMEIRAPKSNPDFWRRLAARARALTHAPNLSAFLALHGAPDPRHVKHPAGYWLPISPFKV